MATSAIRVSGATSPAPDYTDLSSWEFGEQRSLSSGDPTEIAELYNDWAAGLDDSLTIDGWSGQSASNYVEIRPASTNGTQGASLHDGTPGSGARVIASATGPIIECKDPYVHLAGVEIENTGIASALDINSGYGSVRDCIVRGGTDGSSGHGIRVNTSSSGSTLTNVLVYGCGADGVWVTSYRTNIELTHCTLVSNGRYGINHSAAGLNNDVTARHTVSWGNATADFYGGANSLHSDSDYNASGDGSHSGSNSFTLSADPFWDSTSDDYRHGSGSELTDAGGTSGAGVEDDCVGTSRPQGAAYDIGWFEYVATGGSTVSLSGAATATSAGSGALTVAKALAGAAAAVADAAGVLSRALSLAGSAEASAAGSGSLGVTVGLAGQADAQASGEGALAVARALAGEASAQAAGSGDLTIQGQVSLAGSATATSQGQAALSVARALAGVAVAVADGEGTLTVGQTVALEGVVAAAQSVATGALGVTRGLTGAAAAQAAGEGALALQVSLAGAAEALAAGSGDLGVLRSLEGAAAAVAAASGALTTHVVDVAEISITFGAGLSPAIAFTGRSPSITFVGRSPSITFH